MTDYSRMDAALAFLAPYGPELANGFTSHAPMVSEALAALGRADAVLPWLEQEQPSFVSRRDAAHAIDPDEWADALGNDAPSDWAAFFTRELDRQDWREVLGRWVPRLIPAHGAHAAHGVIRVGHAARSLADAETPARLRELADALGYWASCYATLPAADGPSAGLAPREAIARVPLLPAGRRRSHGSITAALGALAGFAEFHPVINILDTGGDVAHHLSELSETLARVFLANAQDRLTTIVFIHGVTGAAALRSLLPCLDEESAREGLRYAWQTGAALYSAYATRPPDMGAIAEPDGGREALIDAAVKNGDDHAIKFTEACLREYALNPSPAYLAAAWQAAGTLA